MINIKISQKKKIPVSLQGSFMQFCICRIKCKSAAILEDFSFTSILSSVLSAKSAISWIKRSIF